MDARSRPGDYGDAAGGFGGLTLMLVLWPGLLFAKPNHQISARTMITATMMPTIMPTPEPPPSPTTTVSWCSSVMRQILPFRKLWALVAVSYGRRSAVAAVLAYFGGNTNRVSAWKL